MREYYIWCSSGIDLRAPVVRHIFYDLFLEHKYCCYTNYADDTPPYVVANNTAKVVRNLINHAEPLYFVC